MLKILLLLYAVAFVVGVVNAMPLERERNVSDKLMNFFAFIFPFYIFPILFLTH